MVKQINLTPPGLLHSWAIAGSSLTKVAEGLPSTGAAWPWARAEGDPSCARTLPPVPWSDRGLSVVDGVACQHRHGLSKLFGSVQLLGSFS